MEVRAAWSASGGGHVSCKPVEPAWIAKCEHVLVQLGALVTENNTLVEAHDIEVQLINDLIARYPEALPDAEHERAMGLKDSVTGKEIQFEILQGELKSSSSAMQRFFPSRRS